MISEVLSDYLLKHDVPFSIITHQDKYTALEVSQAAHVSGKKVAKSVLLWVDDCLSVVVIPANCRIDFDELADELGANQVELASEGEYAQLHQQDIQTRPPFGNLFGVPVYVANSFGKGGDIYINGGNHHQMVRLAWLDFLATAQPRIIDHGFHTTLTPAKVSRKRRDYIH